MQIEKRLSHGCSPAPPGHFHAARVGSASAPPRVLWGAVPKGSPTLCSVGSHSSEGGRFNHRDHLKILQPRTWLGGTLWGKPVKGWRRPQRREHQAEPWPGSRPGGGRTGLAPRTLLGADGQRGERRQSTRSAGPSQLLISPLSSRFHLDGGLASSFRTCLKCHISKRSPSALLPSNSTIFNRSIQFFPFCPGTKYLLFFIRQWTVPTTEAGTLHIIHYCARR